MRRGTALTVVSALLMSLAATAPAGAGRGTRVRSAVGNIVTVEAGWFEMGARDEDVEFARDLCIDSAEGRGREDGCRVEMFTDELPAHRVHLSAFRIDRTEVSNRAYGRCVAASLCTPSRLSDTDVRLGHPDHPVASITHAQARSYCKWVGGALPSEAQWERAARGGSARRFPWGRFFNSRLANHGTLDGQPGPADGYPYAAPVTAFPDGRSAHGLLNMAGNVWELVSDRYGSDYYEHSERIDPSGPEDGEERVVRGGSWRSPTHTLRVTERARLREDDSRPDVGFRCAYKLPDRR